jgi:hypothetical protein
VRARPFCLCSNSETSPSKPLSMEIADIELLPRTNMSGAHVPSEPPTKGVRYRHMPKPLRKKLDFSKYFPRLPIRRGLGLPCLHTLIGTALHPGGGYGAAMWPMVYCGSYLHRLMWVSDIWSHPALNTGSTPTCSHQ